MKKNPNKKASSDEDSYRFTVFLPAETAKLLLDEAYWQDRNTSQMARFIIIQHYKQREATSLQNEHGRAIPTFPDHAGQVPLRRDVNG